MGKDQAYWDAMVHQLESRYTTYIETFDKILATESDIPTRCRLLKECTETLGDFLDQVNMVDQEFEIPSARVASFQALSTQAKERTDLLSKMLFDLYPPADPTQNTH